MANERSQNSLKREEKRNSSETICFREEIEKFLDLTSANNNIAYFLRQDLAKMTNDEVDLFINTITQVSQTFLTHEEDQLVNKRLLA